MEILRTTELRIGNSILNHKGEIEKVKAIGIEGYVWFDEERNLSVELCQPIPLTEDWLLNFGWELDHNSNDLKSFINYKLDLDAINFSPSRNEFYYNCWEESKCPKYVHELQNVYFALTGEELTLIEKS